MTVIEVRAIAVSVEKRSDCNQWICDEAGNVIETHEHAGAFKGGAKRQMDTTESEIAVALGKRRAGKHRCFKSVVEIRII
jgi:hypothetical protein